MRQRRKNSIVNRRTTKVSLAVLLVGATVVLGGYYLIQEQALERMEIIVPDLSAEAKLGQLAFQANCVTCHGQHGAGTDKGPPLVNDIYRPAHHGDISFVRAVTLGVPQHHWFFGPMPAQPQVERKQISQIVSYIRELQQANGIK